MNLSEDQILALAPDDASRKSGKDLASPAKWVSKDNQLAIQKCTIFEHYPGFKSVSQPAPLHIHVIQITSG